MRRKFHRGYPNIPSNFVVRARGELSLFLLSALAFSFSPLATLGFLTPKLLGKLVRARHCTQNRDSSTEFKIESRFPLFLSSLPSLLPIEKRRILSCKNISNEYHFTNLKRTQNLHLFIYFPCVLTFNKKK